MREEIGILSSCDTVTDFKAQAVKILLQDHNRIDVIVKSAEHLKSAGAKGSKKLVQTLKTLEPALKDVDPGSRATLIQHALRRAGGKIIIFRRKKSKQ